jgi:hypothetical protein
MKDVSEATKLHLDSIEIPLMDFIKEGIVIVSDRLKLLYTNERGKVICQKLQNDDPNNLPSIFKEIAYKFKNHSGDLAKVIRKEYSHSTHCTLRIRAMNLNEIGIVSQGIDKPWIIFCMEDRNWSLQEDLILEQEQYGLTQRETEVLQLLLQSNTYKDIAVKLHIGLNTVRFHVKNINMKKRELSIV